MPNLNNSPEQQEYDSKKEHLTKLEEQLFELELEFNTLQAELFRFRNKYTELVVKKMFYLDKVEVEIAEYLVSTDPNNPEYRQRLIKFNKQVAEAKKSLSDNKAISSNKEFKPTDSLKNLYRETAKKVHPDLSVHDEERSERTRIMAEINKAYKNGDEKKLERIYNEWQYAPENVTGDDIASQLVKIIRQIAQVESRIADIEEEINIIIETDIYQLMKNSIESGKDGIDLLVQMSGYLDTQIHERKKYLEYLKQGGE